MEYYYNLHYRRFQRWIDESGIPPFIGIIAFSFVFIILSKIVFTKIVLSKWVYFIIANAAEFNLSNSKRINHLKTIFSIKDFYKIRIVDNLLISLPFQLFLITENEWLICLLLLISSIGLAMIQRRAIFNRSLPTPFKAFPFETIVGFRKTILLLLLIYFVIFKSIQVNNFNLGLVGLAFIFLIFTSYYFKAEHISFAWIFSDDANSFLLKKLKFGYISSLITSAPVVTCLAIAFPDKILFILLVELLGFGILTTIILAKYSTFPKEMSIIQIILFSLTIWFPPMILLIIPIFYKHSNKNLKNILE